MKKLFPGHYAPSVPFPEALKEALVVFDTNVLLNFYDLGPHTRSRSFNTLREIKDRCWLPYHVALEFHRNRIGRVERAVKNHRDAVRNVSKAIGDIAQTIERQDILKNDDDAIRLVQALKSAGQDLVDHAEKATSLLPQRSSEDPVNDYLAELFDERVGAPPTQERVDSINVIGHRRFEHGHPPGLTDATEKADQKFMDRDVTYSGKYGDLYIWMQMLDLAKHARDKKHLIFVTDERKRDWWAKDGGNLLGPAPELAQELALVAPGWKLWMYGSPRFFELLSETVSVKLSDEDLDEIREVSEAQEVAIRGAVDEFRRFTVELPKTFKAIRNWKLDLRIPDHRGLIDAYEAWIRTLAGSPSNHLTLESTKTRDVLVFSEVTSLGEDLQKFCVCLLGHRKSILVSDFGGFMDEAVRATTTQGVDVTVIYDTTGLEEELAVSVLHTVEKVCSASLKKPTGGVYVAHVSDSVVHKVRIA